MPEVQRPLSFGDLKTLLGHAIDRGGDSELDDTLRSQLLNAAEQFMCNEFGGDAYFLELTEAFTLEPTDSPEMGGYGRFTMPEQIAYVISIRDQANLRQLNKVDRERWNAYITDNEATTGTPVAWCQFGYQRRTSSESPGQPYGQSDLWFWPTPSDSVTLNRDCILRPGHMRYDDDYPVIPMSFHFGLIEVAAWFAGAYESGRGGYEKHRELAQVWLQTARRDAVRMKAISGNTQMIPAEDHLRRSGGLAITPPLRLNQFYGG